VAPIKLSATTLSEVTHRFHKFQEMNEIKRNVQGVAEIVSSALMKNPTLVPLFAIHLVFSFWLQKNKTYKEFCHNFN